MIRIALLSLALVSSAVDAADMNECLSKAETKFDAASCYGLELERLDKDLNDAYRQALRKIATLDGLNEKQKQGVHDLLQNAQRMWIRFRDLDCGAVSTAYGSGTGYALGEGQCVIELTKHRIEELSRWQRW